MNRRMFLAAFTAAVLSPRLAKPDAYLIGKIEFASAEAVEREFRLRPGTLSGIPSGHVNRQYLAARKSWGKTIEDALNGRQSAWENCESEMRLRRLFRENGLPPISRGSRRDMSLAPFFEWEAEIRRRAAQEERHGLQ